MAIRDYRFENLPRSVQVVIFAVVVGCLAFVFYIYYLKDLIQQRDVIHTEIARLERSVAQGTAIENQLKRFKQELAQLEERLAVLQSILPSEKETPAILRSVQRMAASSNLKINRFAPMPMAPRSFYSDWPIQIEVEGNYDGLGLFFEKISQATRIIDVGDISIDGLDKPPADGTATLTAGCTATTFVFREDQAPTPDEKSKKEGEDSVMVRRFSKAIAQSKNPALFGLSLGRAENRGFRQLCLMLLPMLLYFPLTSIAANNSTPAASASQIKKPLESPIKYSGVLYRSGNRRDPFINPLLGKKTIKQSENDEMSRGVPPPGIAGTYIAQATLQGIATRDDSKVAVFRGADSRAYFLKKGDKLFDGYLKEIHDDSVILVRETKFRSGKTLTQDVIKRLRTP